MSRRVESGALRDEPFDTPEDPEKTSCLWFNYYSALQLRNTFLIKHIKKGPPLISPPPASQCSEACSPLFGALKCFIAI